MKRTLFLSLIVVAGLSVFAWAYQGIYTGEQVDSAVGIAIDVGQVSGLVKCGGNDDCGTAVPV